jgi:hypothetical protein
MPDEPEFTNWQEAWEHHARAELDDLRALPAADLLAAVRAGHFGGYYVLWDAITERAALADAAWPLMAVLESDADYLDRYHCATALLRLMQSELWEPVQLSTDTPERPARLAALRAELGRRLGAEHEQR